MQPIPRRDLHVTYNHCVAIDGAPMPVGWLINGANITSEFGPTEWNYINTHLDSHDLPLAEGKPSQSYRQTGNPAEFDNAETALPGDESAHAAACLPVVLDGPLMEYAREAIAARGTAGTEPARYETMPA